MRVLVTNCASALGSRVAESLLSHSVEVVGVGGHSYNKPDYDNLSVAYSYHNFAFCNITFQSFLYDNKYLYDRQLIDAVIHLTEPDMSSIDDTMRLTEYCLDTMKLIRCFERLETKKFILVSSADVYGKSSGRSLPFTEDSATVLSNTESSDNSLILSKLILERYLYNYKDDMNICNVRTYHTYSSRGTDIIKHLVESMIYNEDIEYIKNPDKYTTSFISDYDAADAIVEILYKGESGRTYNVSSDESVNLLSLLGIIRELVAEVTGELYIGNVDFTDNNGRGTYTVSPDRLYKDTGFRPSMDLRKGIKNLVKEVLDHKEGLV